MFRRHVAIVIKNTSHAVPYDTAMVPPVRVVDHGPARIVKDPPLVCTVVYEDTARLDPRVRSVPPGAPGLVDDESGVLESSVDLDPSVIVERRSGVIVENPVPHHIEPGRVVVQNSARIIFPLEKLDVILHPSVIVESAPVIEAAPEIDGAVVREIDIVVGGDQGRITEIQGSIDRRAGRVGPRAYLDRLGM